MRELDVPSPINRCDPIDASEWERTAQSRPGRAEIFQTFSDQLQQIYRVDLHILDIGSGPAFLAEFLLSNMPALRMSLLDFSEPMHELARLRLGQRADRVRFLRRSFKGPDWTRDLGCFDVVVTNQAVHELRHKSRSSALHAQVASILVPGGWYLVCDHFCGVEGMSK